MHEASDHRSPPSNVTPSARRREALAMLATHRSTPRPTPRRSGSLSLMAGVAGIAALTPFWASPVRAGAGQPTSGQISFQDAVTPIAEQIHWMHDFVNVIIFA